MHADSLRIKAVPARPGSNGFTLVEVMVALVIFSLAALALLRLQGAALATTARLDDKALAGIVAQNRAIEVQVAPQAPAFGASAGTETNGGRQWRWTQDVQRTPDPRLQRIEIKVAGDDGGTAASLTVVRPA
jgi:general secretion pathway protein I